MRSIILLWRTCIEKPFKNLRSSTYFGSINLMIVVFELELKWTKETNIMNSNGNRLICEKKKQTVI